MNNVLIMALSVLATISLTVAGVLVARLGPDAGIGAGVLLGLGLVSAVLGVQAARRHRKEGR